MKVPETGCLRTGCILMVMPLEGRQSQYCQYTPVQSRGNALGFAKR